MWNGYIVRVSISVNVILSRVIRVRYICIHIYDKSVCVCVREREMINYIYIYISIYLTLWTPQLYVPSLIIYMYISTSGVIRVMRFTRVIRVIRVIDRDEGTAVCPH